MLVLSRRFRKSYKACGTKKLEFGTEDIKPSSERSNSAILMLGVHQECRRNDDTTSDGTCGYRPQQHQGLPAALPRRVLRKEDFPDQVYDREVAAVVQFLISD